MQRNTDNCDSSATANIPLLLSRLCRTHPQVLFKFSHVKSRVLSSDENISHSYEDTDTNEPEPEEGFNKRAKRAH